MRILYISTTLDRFVGEPLGHAGNYYLDLYLEISKHACVDVVAPMLKDSLQYEKSGNLRVFRFAPIKPPTSLESMLKSTDIFKIPLILFNLYRQAFHLLKINDYDVVHGIFIVPSGFIVSILPTKGIKVISGLGTDVHTLSYKPVISSLYRRIFKNVDGVIYNTPSMRSQLRSLGAPDLKYIPTPLNRNFFKLSKPAPKKPYFVFTGRLTKEKGVIILLKAFKKVLPELPEAKLTIIGDGPEKENIMNFIERNRLKENIKLTGSLSSEKITEILKNSYALLLPSYREGTPSSVLEAMSVGRPIVSTNVGGLKNLIDKEIGYLTRVGNIDQFAKAILKVSRQKYNPKIISCRTRQFDTRIIARQYLDYYQKIIDEK